MTMNSLQDLFTETLRDVYYAEKKLVKTLPGMAKKAQSEELRYAIESHLAETEGQVERLEEVFKAMGLKATAKKCEALEGLLSEATEVLGDIKDSETRDAAIISSAQTVEHYEIARYGTLCRWAKDLGRHDVAAILAETLEEEKAADSKLTDIAESEVNSQAA